MNPDYMIPTVGSKCCGMGKDLAGRLGRSISRLKNAAVCFAE
jgi:hypothetical protein